MNLNPYLDFGGDCEEAFKFYAKVLGGQIDAMMRWGDHPDCGDGTAEIPKEHHGKIMHARLVVDGNVLMGSDNPPQYPHEGVKGARVSINVESAGEAERVFAALSEGGNVEMPLAETFWAERFGMFTDRFGVPWMVNCSKPQ